MSRRCAWIAGRSFLARRHDRAIPAARGSAQLEFGRNHFCVCDLGTCRVLARVESGGIFKPALVAVPGSSIAGSIPYSAACHRVHQLTTTLGSQKPTERHDQLIVQNTGVGRKTARTVQRYAPAVGTEITCEGQPLKETRMTPLPVTVQLSASRPRGASTVHLRLSLRSTPALTGGSCIRRW
jgi:hypothetical protein